MFGLFLRMLLFSFLLVIVFRINLSYTSLICRLSPVAVFLWSHLTRGYLGVYMFPQNYMDIEDGVENLQILNTVASPGDLDTQRLVC